MDNIEEREANQLLVKARTILDQNDLSDDERQNLQLLVAKLSGQLLSVWFPRDWGRRLLMLTILLVGFYGLISSFHTLAWCLLSLPFFSPRIVGTVAFAAGILAKYTGLLNR